jgi:hypothetical protein
MLDQETKDKYARYTVFLDKTKLEAAYASGALAEFGFTDDQIKNRAIYGEERLRAWDIIAKLDRATQKLRHSYVLEKSETDGYSVNKIRRNLTEIATFNPLDIYKDIRTGELLPIEEWPEGAATALKRVTPTNWGSKVEFEDRMEAIKLLAMRHPEFQRRVDVEEINVKVITSFGKGGNLNQDIEKVDVSDPMALIDSASEESKKSFEEAEVIDAEQ